MPLVGQGISRAWVSIGGNGARQWFMCHRIDNAPRGATDGRPFGVRQAPGPAPSMPFERIVQPEPATTGLVAGNRLPDCRWICNEMIDFQPQWSRGFSTVDPPSAPNVDASSRSRPTASVFSTESQTRNIRQLRAPDQSQLAARMARGAAGSCCS
jgi:hypothetical protein